MERVSKGLMLVVVLFAVAAGVPSARAQAPLRVAIVGLVHDHARGLFGPLSKNTNVQLVGIAEPDTALAARYAAQFHLDQKLLFTDTDRMLDQVHPDAVLVYTSIVDHRKAIEAAARRGISAMVEKPLATTVEDALAIRKAAREHPVQVLVNYETTWYASNAEIGREVSAGKLGAIRRVVVEDGHEGPKEIGVGPEFLGWLTDPEKNGAGAMFDFGCYGADLMTWLMHGETPLSVTAVALTDKPEIYPRVDDDATIIVRYPKAEAVLEPSWNWPFGRKDIEVYGATGYAIATGGNELRVRAAGDKAEADVALPPLAGARQNSLDYLAAALRGEIHPDGDLSSLETNVIVVQILAAARESARTGRTVELKPLPK
jgi:predicted dehydrogenase